MFIKFFNLQMFATVVQTTLMGSQNAEGAYIAGSATNSLTAEMKTFYDMTLLDEAQANLVHDQFGQKRPIPANGGKIIEFRKFSSLPKALTPITEGVTPDGNSLHVTTVTAEVHQYGDFIVQSDVLELTAIDNTILEATKILGRQAGMTLDTIVRDVLATNTNWNFCPKIASSGAETAVTTEAGMDNTCKLTVKQIQKAVAKLRAQNAPTIGGDYVAILHPYVAFDLMRDTEWTDAAKYGAPTQLFEGEIGKIAGVRFVQSTEAKVTASGSFITFIFGEGAYGVTEVTGGGLQTIVKQKGSAGTADPLDQRSSVGWKAIKTAEILNPNYLIAICSKSPEFGTVAAN